MADDRGDTEDAACQFVYARATERDKRRRQILIDAGYDPDTLRKL